MSHCGFAALPVAMVDTEPIGKDEWMAIVAANRFEGPNQIKLERLAAHVARKIGRARLPKEIDLPGIFEELLLAFRSYFACYGATLGIAVSRKPILARFERVERHLP